MSGKLSSPYTAFTVDYFGFRPKRIPSPMLMLKQGMSGNDGLLKNNRLPMRLDGIRLVEIEARLHVGQYVASITKFAILAWPT